MKKFSLKIFPLCGISIPERRDGEFGEFLEKAFSPSTHDPARPGRSEHTHGGREIETRVLFGAHLTVDSSKRKVTGWDLMSKS